MRVRSACGVEKSNSAHASAMRGKSCGRKDLRSSQCLNATYLQGTQCMGYFGRPHEWNGSYVSMSWASLMRLEDSLTK